MTVAETFTVIVFILLLAFGALILQEYAQQKAALDAAQNAEERIAVALLDLKQAQAESEEARERAAYLDNELSRLQGGRGVDPPPCWLSGGAAQRMFRIDLTADGFRLYRTEVPGRANDRYLQYAEEIVPGHEYTPAEFSEVTRPLYESSVRSGCRHWIEPVDLTGTDKDLYIERRNQLSRHFWFRESDIR